MAARRTARRYIQAARSLWRRSLLVRVVAATVALGVLVLLLVGQFLLERISNDLVESARTAAQNDATQQTKDTIASNRTQKFEDEQDFRQWAQQTLNNLHGPSDAPLRYVALLKQIDTAPGPLTNQARGIDAGAIPVELRREVAASRDQLITKVVSLSIQDGLASSSMERAIAVGSLVEFGPLGAGADEQGNGRYELYFVYPLDREVAILADVRRTFLAGAAALVVLIGLVAWVVTRQVVAPVRQAAQAAEQLASGRLDRRIPVRGEDDLARLGRAFNEMATSLERQIHQLEELSWVQRRFVSDVSHELRTPLTTIRMAGEVIHEARTDFAPALARTSELLQTQLDRFESLLSDLLEVSRFDAGAAQLELEQVDLREVVARVVEHLRPLADGKGCRLVVHAPREVAMAEIDTRRVERIARNLIGNAIEHGEGRPIDIRVAMDDAAIAVGVRDHGVGLSPADVRQVFDRFWRADPARARSTGGTGLGLAIALEDAHLHGGWLQAWGEPGGGAHFRLTLPRRSGEVLGSSPMALIPQDMSSKKRAAAVLAAEPL
jgi:two-component system sensor histidine kinase MtrB